jgi:hypothetical protein
MWRQPPFVFAQGELSVVLARAKPGAPSEVSLLAGVTKLYYFCLPLRFDLRWGFDELRDNGGNGWGCSKIAN